MDKNVLIINCRYCNKGEHVLLAIMNKNNIILQVYVFEANARYILYYMTILREKSAFQDLYQYACFESNNKIKL